MTNEGNHGGRRDGAGRRSDSADQAPLICANPHCNRLACLEYTGGNKWRISGLCKEHLVISKIALTKQSEGVKDYARGDDRKQYAGHYSGADITPW